MGQDAGICITSIRIRIIMQAAELAGLKFNILLATKIKNIVICNESAILKTYVCFA